MAFEKRHDVIELHEQSWMPDSIRDTFREVLEWVQIFTGAYAPLVPIQIRWIKESGISGYMDLCTGSGGLTAWLLYRVRCLGVWPQVLLTDLYPHTASYENLVARHGKDLAFCAQSVDATNVLKYPIYAGRTMLSAFHHFSPTVARAILKNAVDGGDAVLVADPFSRNLFHAVAMAASALFSPLYPLLGGRFSLRALLWCVLCPVILLMMVWDGFASVMRGYSLQELREITNGIDASGYVWEVGHFRYWRCFKGIYLTGKPKK